MKTRSIAAVCSLLVAAAPSLVVAQRPGAIEVGGFGRASFYPDTLNLDPGFGGGGRLGFFVRRNLSIEADLSYSESNVKRLAFAGDTLDKVSHELWQARLLFGAPISGRTQFLIGAGYAYDAWGMLRRYPARGGGPSGLLGLRLGITDRVSARLEAYGNFVPEGEKNQLQRPNYFVLGAQAGVSATFRNQREVVGGGTTIAMARVDTVTISRVDTIFRDRIPSGTESGAAAGAAAGAGMGAGRGGPGSTVVIGVVNFDFDRAEISSDARRILDEIASSLTRPGNEALRLEVVGNTDAIGGESYNQRLSERRAAAVMEYLGTKGISSGRLTTRAAGEQNPVASNGNPEGRATNRRALISLINQ